MAFKAEHLEEVVIVDELLLLGLAHVGQGVVLAAQLVRQLGFQQLGHLGNRGRGPGIRRVRQSRTKMV